MSKPVILFLAILAPALSICLALLGLETLQKNILGWFLLVMGVAYPAGAVIYWFLKRRPFWEAATERSERGSEPSQQRSGGGWEAATERSERGSEPSQTHSGGGWEAATDHSGSEREPAETVHVLREETGDRSFWVILPGFLAVFFAPPLEWYYLPEWLPRTIWMQAAGVILVLAAASLRVWARAHIRGLYSGHVQVRKDDRLVRSGPYRIIRHPGYTGFLLMALGIAAGYASWIGLAAVLVLLLPGLAYRLKVEERLLGEQFGEEYRNYAAKTKALIPGVW